MAVPPLTAHTAKMCVCEDLVTIRPAVAEQSRQKKKDDKHKTHRNTYDDAFA